MNKPIIITLSKNDYLDKAFKILPSNAIIYKGRCGIGGTTLEIKALRCSIIIVPTNGIITDKCAQHKNLFPVRRRVTPEHIAEYLQNDVEHKKIITTPDSFHKIIKAAISINGLQELYDNFFLLCDEAHTVVTEAFRKAVRSPYKYLWNFASKTFISATPYEFSDPRIAQLQRYEIKFKEPYLQELDLVVTENVNECIDFYIRNRDSFPGNIHIFLNSVTEAADLIRRNNLKNEVHLYCADKEDNFEKLNEQLEVFVQVPTTGEYARINIYTSKYFEGFDLKDDNATIILVTDIHKAHTKVGISNKGVQAVGRIRTIPHQVIHITNHRNKKEMKKKEAFMKENTIHANCLIDQYNSYVETCKQEDITPLESAQTPIANYADIDEHTHVATYDPYLFDQVINQSVCNEEYNDQGFIVKSWEKALYKVNQLAFSTTRKSGGRKSKATLLKELVETIEQLEANKDNYVMNVATKKLDEIRKEHPLAWEAYHLLGKAGFEKHNYKMRDIEAALYETHNRNMEPRLLAYLSDKILIGERYTTDEATNILQFAYNLYRIRDTKTGKIKKAKAIDLKSPGWFQTRDAKKEVKGTLKPAQYIEKVLFTVTKAA